MTKDVVRLYAIVLTVLALFGVWAVVAARPWAEPAAAVAPDPRIAALERREANLQKRAASAQKIVARRMAEYRAAVARAAAVARQPAPAPVQAAAPAPVRIVQAAPITSSRSS